MPYKHLAFGKYWKILHGRKDNLLDWPTPYFIIPSQWPLTFFTSIDFGGVGLTQVSGFFNYSRGNFSLR